MTVLDSTAAPEAALRVAESLDQLIGRTPLLRLRAPGLAPDVRVLAKLEGANPLSSSKDRAALRMVEAAEAAGLLRPGSTVVEATSGNTGISLASLAAARGYRCVIVMPDNATRERILTVELLGAEVVLTAADSGFRGAVERAEELAATVPQAWMPRQHENPENVAAHYTTTGPEIWSALQGRVDVIVAGVGTGGTLTGTARYLKEQSADVRCVAVEPADSPVISQGWGGRHGIPGLNGGFLADTTDVSVVDEVLTVTDREAKQAALHLARSAGLLVGISSGAAAHAAFALARRPESGGLTIVAVLPDSGERYLSVLGTE
jgi:cysteine synthase